MGSQFQPFHVFTHYNKGSWVHFDLLSRTYHIFCSQMLKVSGLLVPSSLPLVVNPILIACECRSRCAGQRLEACSSFRSSARNSVWLSAGGSHEDRTASPKATAKRLARTDPSATLYPTERHKVAPFGANGALRRRQARVRSRYPWSVSSQWKPAKPRSISLG